MPATQCGRRSLRGCGRNRVSGPTVRGLSGTDVPERAGRSEPRIMPAAWPVDKSGRSASVPGLPPPGPRGRRQQPAALIAVVARARPGHARGMPPGRPGGRSPGNAHSGRGSPRRPIPSPRTAARPGLRRRRMICAVTAGAAPKTGRPGTIATATGCAGWHRSPARRAGRWMRVPSRRPDSGDEAPLYHAPASNSRHRRGWPGARWPARDAASPPATPRPGGAACAAGVAHAVSAMRVRVSRS